MTYKTTSKTWRNLHLIFVKGNLIVLQSVIDSGIECLRRIHNDFCEALLISWIIALQRENLSDTYAIISIILLSMEPYGLTHCARLTRHVTESICLSAIHLHPKIRLGSDVTRHALRAQGQEGVEGSRHARVQRFAQVWPRDRWPINTQRRGYVVACRLDIAVVAVLGVLEHPLGHLGIKRNCLWYFRSLISFPSLFFSSSFPFY